MIAFPAGMVYVRVTASPNVPTENYKTQIGGVLKKEEL